MKKVSDIGEISLIKKISEILKTKSPSVLCGIGDDAAVLGFQNRKLLLTTDALLESVHFDWKYAEPFLLGRKSLAVNFSDMAAMGGRPLWAVVSLAVSPRASVLKVLDFHRGLKKIADEFGVVIVGGDTDHSPSGWKITVTVVGEVERPIYRSGAKVGDQIWVTGEVGNSALGLELLKRRRLRPEAGGRKGKTLHASHFMLHKFLKAHLDPVPRVREGQMLAKEKMATSLIDVSDGLLLDLGHICQVSQVGAKIEWKKVPLASGFLEGCQMMKKDPVALTLSGGEDYELLFTAPRRNQKKILDQFRRMGTKVTCIGEVVSRGRGVKVLGESVRFLRFQKKGYQHF